MFRGPAELLFEYLAEMIAVTEAAAQGDFSD